MPQDKIIIHGAREHNLKNIHLEIPRDQLVVLTGISGSGKSTLAFDTIYAEGQRRYVESLSSYARQFLGVMDKPDVDYIEGLSPAVSIDQKSTSHNPRSTVGTVTEIYDYLRLLFARVGRPHCPQCGKPITRQTVDGILDAVMRLPEGSKIQILAPVVRGRKGEYRHVFEEIHRLGFVRVRVDGQMYEVTDEIQLDRYKQHTLEVVVDRLVVKAGIESRLAESVETALKLAKGLVGVQVLEGEEMLFSEHFACAECGINVGELEPRNFSFNSPYGACPECSGLGTKTEFDPDLIIPDKNKSIAQGALAPFLKRDGEMTEWRTAMLEGIARRYGFTLQTPISELTPSQLHTLLYGAEDNVTVAFRNRWGRTRYIDTEFEGVVNILKRRYEETESEWTRQDLERFMSTKPCPRCQGKRLKEESLAVTVAGKNIAEVTAMSIEEAVGWFDKLEERLPPRERTIAERVLKEVRRRLGFLLDVGLGYLTLDRPANTLAGGEAQRIRLATQIGSGLMGVLYILDEPSIGLHQRDNQKLIHTLLRLRDLGNTVIVVEHDEETIRHADFIVDLGPGAGEHGGQVVVAGTLEEVMSCPESLTGHYLAGRRRIEIPKQRREPNPERVLILKGARHNNLQNITVRFPLGLFICVTGVSGSGKSSLVQETLYPRLMYHVYGTRAAWGEHDGIERLEWIDKVVDIDQSPIGRTPRSNPATYTGVFDLIRELFAGTPEARIRGYSPGRFSFNVKGGRCEACRGDGMIKIEMQFLPDVYVPCEVCKGKRYNRETLEVKLKGKTIAEVLEMTVEEAVEFFAAFPPILRKLKTLHDVGLDYIKLGQPAPTLSGGEAQRVKLATELAKKGTGNTVYILDEPTTGLHAEDIRKLLGVLHRLVDAGNTVIVIEHNLDVIKTADWIIDLGPEGGKAGGWIVAEGPPEYVATVEASYTGQFLRGILGNGSPLE